MRYIQTVILAPLGELNSMISLSIPSSRPSRECLVVSFVTNKITELLHLCLVCSRAAGSSEHAATDTDGPESASKRRRRSEDRDVGEATVNAGEADQPATENGAMPVNGHTVTDANGGVPPEAAFWSALEDSKDEVGSLRLLTFVVNQFDKCIVVPMRGAW